VPRHVQTRRQSEALADDRRLRLQADFDGDVFHGSIPLVRLSDEPRLVEMPATDKLAKKILIPISLGNATFGGFIVGRASRLPSKDLPTQARRPRYIQKSKSKLLLVGSGVFLQKTHFQRTK
jgi:hypothetical protein